ncbi:E3 ubiquitin-protein ligase RNF166 [Aplysia californica]|uniref:E3 ubiquitin-protein ligase RNF166 n=1 Tax=Aplysia californica TaxID=6500 RepID=A0ABM0JZN2_APLCA|nr:E3 ubiquitin-protein ligase RNF166 [Aplysia californica]
METDYPHAAEEEFECAICMDSYSEPHVLHPCRHSFCLACIQRLQAEKTVTKCPKCRSVVQRCDPDAEINERLSCRLLQCGDCKMDVLALYMKQHRMICPSAKTQQELARVSQAGASRGPAVNRSTFSCPYCGEANLLCSQLVDHCNTQHWNSKKKVVCPVCASMPWGVSNMKSSNFLQHLNMRHKFEYETYVDFGQDDDAMLQAAIQASIQEN